MVALRIAAVVGEPLLVPSIFWLETVSVLARRYRYEPPTIVEAVYELEQVGIATAEVGRPGVRPSSTRLAAWGSPPTTPRTSSLPSQWTRSSSPSTPSSPRPLTIGPSWSPRRVASRSRPRATRQGGRGPTGKARRPTWPSSDRPSDHAEARYPLHCDQARAWRSSMLAPKDFSISTVARATLAPGARNYELERESGSI